MRNAAARKIMTLGSNRPSVTPSVCKRHASRIGAATSSSCTPRPIRFAIDPAILWEPSIRQLNGRKPDQRAQGSSRLAGRQKRGRALHQIACPDQMITAEIAVVLGLTPRDAHRCNQSALKCFILMGEQDAATQAIHGTAVRRVIAEVILRIDDCALPLPNIGFAMNIERFRQRLQQLRHSALVTPAQSNRDRKFIAVLKIDFPGQRNVAVLRGRKFPVHFEIIHQILPTVARPDIANRPPQKSAAASHDQMQIFALGMKQFVAADFGTPTRVARAVAREVWSQERVEMQFPV